MKQGRQQLFHCLKELAVTSDPKAPLPRFASLPEAPASVAPLRSRLARFFLSPFADVDDRVARLALAQQAEAERENAKSAAVGRRRS